ncbi:MAG: carboxypeptidase regulatory-like domain-containing protein [Bacteroidetes bacterium]|nr:carboxypeptidase regulatory-like domain-containing protein [Bacteroidota bacterium]
MKNFFVLIILSLFTISLNSQTINIDPDTLEATLNVNSTVTVHTILSNTGSDTLTFAFPGYGQRAWGGPDEFGYYWIDSDEEGGPPWEYNDISETGSLVVGIEDDNTVGPFEFGFEFPFYGETKSLFWINSNGCITFTDQEMPYINDSIPTNSDLVSFIAWFWDDLKPVEGLSKVYIKHFDMYVIIQFNKFVQYLGSESYIFGQVVMKSNGDILLKYRHITGEFNSSAGTVGIQSPDPGVGLQVVCDAPYLHPEMIVRFDYPRTFITSVEPASAYLLPGTQETIWITYCSEGYEHGTYTANLRCVSNDPVNPETYIYNIMHVVAPEPAGFKGYVTDAASGEAINDVKVIAGEQYVYTNASGYYELPLEHGTYTVKFSREGYETLIVEDTVAVPGYSTLDVELSGYYFIVGRVWAGENWLETGFAYGFKMLEGYVVDVYAEMIAGEGYYEFSGLTAAQYIIKAEPSPNSAYYGLYLPTYYGDVLHWEDATVINLTQNTDGVHIHLVPVSIPPQGPGSISGQILTGAFTPTAANIPVILQSATTDFVAMNYSGSDGSFYFSNLAFDTYKLFAEIPGKSIVPMSIVLDEGNTTVSDITMMILDESIIFVGINDPDMSGTYSSVYPNPATDRISLDYQMKSPSVLTVSLLDHTGRMITSRAISCDASGNISLDIRDLPAGIYYVRLMTHQGGQSVKMFSKVSRN